MECLFWTHSSHKQSCRLGLLGSGVFWKAFESENCIIWDLKLKTSKETGTFSSILRFKIVNAFEFLKKRLCFMTVPRLRSRITKTRSRAAKLPRRWLCYRRSTWSRKNFNKKPSSIAPFKYLRFQSDLKKRLYWFQTRFFSLPFFLHLYAVRV